MKQKYTTRTTNLFIYMQPENPILPINITPAVKKRLFPLTIHECTTKSILKQIKLLKICNRYVVGTLYYQLFSHNTYEAIFVLIFYLESIPIMYCLYSFARSRSDLCVNSEPRKANIIQKYFWLGSGFFKLKVTVFCL